MLGAETEGMIGYMIEQELGNLLPFERPFATLLTMVEVDPRRPGLPGPDQVHRPGLRRGRRPSAEAAEKGWTVKPDGDKWRRVVPSPLPKRIFELRPIQWLLEKDTIVICAGGGGIPTMYEPGANRRLVGVECVIDKDRATALLARELERRLSSSAPPTPTRSTSTGASPTQRAIRSAIARRAGRATPSPPARWARRSRPRRTSPAPPAAARSSAPSPTCPPRCAARRARRSPTDAGETAFH